MTTVARRDRRRLRYDLSQPEAELGLWTLTGRDSALSLARARPTDSHSALLRSSPDAGYATTTPPSVAPGARLVALGRSGRSDHTASLRFAPHRAGPHRPALLSANRRNRRDGIVETSDGGVSLSLSRDSIKGSASTLRMCSGARWPRVVYEDRCFQRR